ncbi:PREDICTED: E3 ubiquitin-protein ligase TRIM17 [Condylura cristata]|uniref:E3 ubiquitin-protein ligase TRIM17 n=1 Tax=Condylura cristata TaxID=143302 RepID=UPI00033450B2|nr:PREDICTED: E3 ubiquitin-protein ligase TRIM17 [Condylura cristata]
MDAVELARKLQEEATCAICLDYFRDPVMTDCGHNFCRECIRLTWEKARSKKGRRKRRDAFPCPECRELSPPRNLRPNRLLTKVAEMARQHPGPQSADLCRAHREPLKLYCEDDRSPICVVCREAREHRAHRVRPVEEAAQECKPDPATAYPHLLLYESRQRRYLSAPPDGVPCGRDRFLAYPCAVGREAFSSGRHYWEVGMNLTGEALWALGVCRADVSRRDRVPKRPENGFWVLQLSKGKRQEPPAPAPEEPGPVTLTEPPSHVGVFLDFEAGEVSFYNLRDGSHLHTYAQAAFSGPLQPFFCLGAPKSGQMVISTVTLWVKG